MYARYGLTPVKSGSRAQMERVVAELLARTRALPGFRRMDVLVDEERSEYGSLSLWETQADAEAAAAAVSPQIRELLGELATGPTTTRIFEVYEPRA